MSDVIKIKCPNPDCGNIDQGMDEDYFDESYESGEELEIDCAECGCEFEIKADVWREVEINDLEIKLVKLAYDDDEEE